MDLFWPLIPGCDTIFSLDYEMMPFMAFHWIYFRPVDEMLLFGLLWPLYIPFALWIFGPFFLFAPILNFELLGPHLIHTGYLKYYLTFMETSQ